MIKCEEWHPKQGWRLRNYKLGNSLREIEAAFYALCLLFLNLIHIIKCYLLSLLLNI